MKKTITLILAALLALSLLTAAFAATYSDKDIVKQVQQALNDAGFDCGTPDGIAGKKTAAAINAYQEANGLKVTGVIDDALIEAMGIGLADESASNTGNAQAEAPAASEQASPAEDFEYNTLEDGTVEIIGYKGSGSEVIIPEELDGKAVTAIGKSAFEECRDLTSVRIPSGVTSIGKRAFYFCSELAHVMIPDSVVSIDDWAFYGCNLTGVTIPDSVISIGVWAFLGNLLTDVTIPDSVTNFGDGVFAQCYKLETIEVSPEHPVLEIIDGLLFSKTDHRLVWVPKEFNTGTFEIPAGTEIIDSYAFSGFDKLTGVTIPDSVKSIGCDAFSYCRGLTSVTIPDGITVIDSFTFSFCDNLAEVTIPDSVTSIEEYAFCRCEKLANVTIPNGVTEICTCAFNGCKKLPRLTIPANVTSIGDGAFEDCDHLTLVVTGGSYAEQYCQEKGLKYEVA